MPYHFLRSKLIDLWNPFKQLILIDLGWGFFIVKFIFEEKYGLSTTTRPLVHIRKLSLSSKMGTKICSQEATLSFTAIWIRLSQLPTKFYDIEILENVGRKLGKLLKIDTCTSSTLRGRYELICIQVPLETLVETSVVIGDHKQSVIYEGKGTLCKGCGRI